MFTNTARNSTSIQIYINDVLVCLLRRRFLEVDSWNTQHGFEASDSVEEKIVDEMKAVQVPYEIMSHLAIHHSGS